MFDYTETQLKELEKKLVSDLEAVRRVMARNIDPDLIRVASLLEVPKPIATPQNLFESSPGKPPVNGNVTVDETKQVILKFATSFRFSDVVKAVSTAHQNRVIRSHVVATALRKLDEEKKIRILVPREGQNGATYVRIE
jgi:hypothetical protein